MADNNFGVIFKLHKDPYDPPNPPQNPVGIPINSLSPTRLLLPDHIFQVYLDIEKYW